jgi:hypothetical protein
LLMLILSGCSSVTSYSPIGLENYNLNEKDWNGIWILPEKEDFVKIKVIDRENGILKAVSIEEKDYHFELNEIVFQIKKGKKWIYANILEEDGKKSNKEYFWGKILNEKGRIIYWFPSVPAFLAASEAKKIKTSVHKSAQVSTGEEASQGLEDTKSVSIILEDDPEAIIDLIENSNENYFDWEHPLMLEKFDK